MGDDKPKASFSKAGISTASASDSFNKAQWEVMERLKVDYKKQTDKKFKKDKEKRKKVDKKEEKKAKKKAKRLQEEAEELQEREAVEKAAAAAEAAAERKARRAAQDEAIVKKGPTMPQTEGHRVGQVSYSDSVQIGQHHSGSRGT